MHRTTAYYSCIMSLDQILSQLRADFSFMENVTAWRSLPAQKGIYADIPSSLDSRLRRLLADRGIHELYRHQAQAVESALAGQNMIIVTPTASGKTLCYNLPVFHSLLTDPDARSLYVFPTKALAQDQLTNLRSWASHLPDPRPIYPAAYDGDTPSNQRGEIRRHANIILTNPDMVHMGILPYHPGWHVFFSNLKFVVLDELHTYRGVFGSHVANVVRRLKRICSHYGSMPQFICTSATIANPQVLAEQLLEQPVALIDRSGAPRGEKQIVLYNPPCYDSERGLRRAATLEAQELAARMVWGQIQTILFGRSRLATELMLTYLRERIARSPEQRRVPTGVSPVERASEPSSKNPHSTFVDNPAQQERFADSVQIRGYRGGYLPQERRTIEAGLRNGTVKAVVATNALELGIDIGQLQAAILCGYPGSIAGTWQQMGRAGRTTEQSVAFLVATSGVLDQYIIQHPEYLFEQPPEYANINPDNLMLLIDQVRCAAFELPFADGEPFGRCPYIQDALLLLHEQGDLEEAHGRYFWSGESYPTRRISLRSSGHERVVIQEQVLPGEDEHGQTGTVSDDRHGATSKRVIGELEKESALLLLHEGAIYMHEGNTYRVEQLDLDILEATVLPVSVDYYTDVKSESEITVIARHQQKQEAGADVAHGEVEVVSQVVSYRRVKRYTHENLGVTPLDYPPARWETSAYWFNLTDAAHDKLIEQGLWRDSPNNYGPNWQAQRKRARHRDGYRCSRCGAPEPKRQQHDVHHIVPFRTFGYVLGINDHYLEANRLDNLTLLCRRCHQVVETGVRVRGGLEGLAYTLQNLAPLHLMCDRSDIGVTYDRGESGASDPDQIARNSPTIYVYERAIAGLGFSNRLFEVHTTLLTGALELIENCPCTHGCPACVGPILDNHIAILETKELTLALLRGLTGQWSESFPKTSIPSHTEDIEF